MPSTLVGQHAGNAACLIMYWLGEFGAVLFKISTSQIRIESVLITVLTFVGGMSRTELLNQEQEQMGSTWIYIKLFIVAVVSGRGLRTRHTNTA